MLKGISPALSPDLLKTLAEMGHGDEIVIAHADYLATLNAIAKRLRAEKAARSAAPPPGE